jgi:hypothetical protein
MPLQKGVRVQPRAAGEMKGTIVETTGKHQWKVKFDDGSHGEFRSKQLKGLSNEQAVVAVEAGALTRQSPHHGGYKEKPTQEGFQSSRGYNGKPLQEEGPQHGRGYNDKPSQGYDQQQHYCCNDKRSRWLRQR